MDAHGVSIKQILSQSAVKAGQAELSRRSAASFCRREERRRSQSLSHTHTHSRMTQSCDWARPDLKTLQAAERHLCQSKDPNEHHYGARTSLPGKKGSRAGATVLECMWFQLNLVALGDFFPLFREGFSSGCELQFPDTV